MTKIYYFTTSVCLVYKIKPKIAFGTSLFFHTCKIQYAIFINGCLATSGDTVGERIKMELMTSFNVDMKLNCKDAGYTGYSF